MSKWVSMSFAQGKFNYQANQKKLAEWAAEHTSRLDSDPLISLSQCSESRPRRSQLKEVGDTELETSTFLTSHSMSIADD